MGRPAALGIAVVLSLTAVTGCGSGPTVAAELWTGPRPTTTAMSAADSRAIDAIGEQVVGAQLPGVWIGVWDAEKGNHIGAYGKAVLPDIPATPDDHGRIGSVSKTFTTATAMRLVDRGKLAMDSTVAQVVPDLAKRYPALAPITVVQLIDMTSGIADYVNTGAIFKPYLADPTKTWTPAEVIGLSQTVANAKPGTPGYTSTATIILGQMIAAVSGQSLEDAVNQTAHDAGLRQTALAAAADPTMPTPASHGYIFGPGVDSLKQAGATVLPGTDVSDWSPVLGRCRGRQVLDHR